MKYNQIKWNIFVLAFYTSCTPIYFPNIINTPFFTEKGQFCGSANYSFSGSMNLSLYNIDLQSAFAVTDNIAVMYNYSFADMGVPDDEYEDFHNHKYQEIGLGYFRSSENIFRFENFIGYGSGKSETHDGTSLVNKYREIKGEYYRMFVCPSFGISTQLKSDNLFDPNRIDVGIASRISSVNWKNLKHNFEVSVREQNYYFEPCIFIRAGWQKLLFQFQLGQIYALYKDELIESSDGWLSFGIITYFDLY